MKFRGILYSEDGIEILGIPANRPFRRSYDLVIWIGNGSFYDVVPIYISRIAIQAHEE